MIKQNSKKKGEKYIKKNHLKEAKKKKKNSRKLPKLGLIYETHNPWNLGPKFNQEA